MLQHPEPYAGSALASGPGRGEREKVAWDILFVKRIAKLAITRYLGTSILLYTISVKLPFIFWKFATYT